MLLIKNVSLFSPEYVGKRDILIGEEKVLKISDEINLPGKWDVEVIDGSSLSAGPGLIDQHVHLIGGGGEGGPETRTPEVNLSQFVEGGITTAIGLLGTDGYTRQLESLLMKVKGLRTEGLSAWMFVGSYQIPTPTLTGKVTTDIAQYEEILGVGEIAISDHRSSSPTVQELIKLATETRVGAMLGNKPGAIHIHMGDGKKQFNPILEVVENSDVPLKHFTPTHINRSKRVFDEALEFGKQGGNLDITSGISPDVGFSDAIKPSEAITKLLDEGILLEQITVSSDGNGSMPDFDENGNLRGLLVAPVSSLYKEFRDLTVKENLSLEKSFTIFTKNVADLLELPKKGRISEGCDADIILLDDNYDLKYVISRGNVMMENGEVIKKGTFE
ncbi:beta-aspartyl-peptidase [Natranaerobius trueperi]|uniref:Isoaspartyl dipeptidase n=1 Tax=Natranaerobius trueperi TaxID=759412 RepID=A0A226BY61_9FIRM|nr:beta-aspartyl-peptidase [Natranaerobius trueperi]OWZ83953.1 beta-aspartyl-peptidase [Natranaerobius trueperi]